MRRVLVAALCLSAGWLAPETRSADPRPDEDLTTWVRIHLDEHMNLLGKPLECWIGSVEGDINAARIGYSVMPEIGHVLQRSGSNSFSGGTVSGSTTTTSSLTVSSSGAVGPPVNSANLWLTGGSAMIGYRYASDTEFFSELRYLEGSHFDTKTSMFNPRFAARMNFSYDEWRLSIMSGLRGLVSFSTLPSGQDAIRSTGDSTTTVSTFTPGSFVPQPGGFPPLFQSGGSNTVRTVIPTDIRAVVASRRQSDIYGGGPELGFGIERDFADTGLSVFARPRAAGIFAQVDRTITYVIPPPGSPVQSSGAAQWFLETGVSLGATWRPTFFPRLQMRIAYDFERFFALERNKYGQGAFLTGHNFIGGFDYSF